jgi:hypothetical protein
VVLSFLSSADFLSSLRCSRRWHAAGLRRHAWPTPRLLHLVQALRDDQYENGQRRKLHLTLLPDVAKQLDALMAAPPASSDETPAQAGVEASASSSLVVPASASMWRHVGEAKVEAAEAFWKDVPFVVFEKALQVMRLLPHLSVLALRGVSTNEAVFRALFEALAPRLEALLLFECSRSSVTHLPLLAPKLKVLALDQFLFSGGGHAIAELQQLHYLHMGTYHASSYAPAHFINEVAHAVSLLSTKHKLRCLSLGRGITRGNFVAQVLAPVKGSAAEAALINSAVLPPAPTEPMMFGQALYVPPVPPPPRAATAMTEELASMPPLDPALPSLLSEVSFADPGHTLPSMIHLACGLPRIQRLSVVVGTVSSLFGDRSTLPLTALRNIRYLRVRLPPNNNRRSDWALNWDHLAAARSLRSLHLSVDSDVAAPVSATQLRRVLVASAATIEELHLGHESRLFEDDTSTPPQPQQQPVPAATTAASSADAGPAAATVASLVPSSNPWSAALGRCRSLRAFSLHLQPEVLSSLAPLLSSLPCFSVLDLSAQVRKLSLPVDLVACASRSSSWSSIHVRVFKQVRKDLPSLEAVLEPQSLPLAKDLSLAFVRRFRVIRHVDPNCTEVATLHVDQAVQHVEWQLQ